MHLSRYNFSRSIPLLTHCLRTADYISIDLEFSGLHLKEAKEKPTDSISDRYSKYRQAVQTFAPLQVGICAFKVEHDELTCMPFNVNVLSSTRLLKADPRTMAFLGKHRFDFNRLFTSAVPYTSLQEHLALGSAASTTSASLSSVSKQSKSSHDWTD